MSNEHKVFDIKKMYDDIRTGNRLSTRYGELINFHGIGDLTVYNATPPVWLKLFGKTERVIIGRVEHKALWAQSCVRIFKRINDNNYVLIDSINPIAINDVPPECSIEDPSVVTIEGEIFLSVVTATKNTIETRYYRGSDLNNLTFFTSVDGKDSRVCPLDNGRILWTPRPKGKIGGLGNIAYVELDSIEQLASVSWNDAKIIKGLFSVDTWGGVNELHFNPKKPAHIGAVCHLAFKDELGLVYFICWIIIDRDSHLIKDVIPLAIREDFPNAGEKRSDLRRVAFGTGVEFVNNSQARLHAGLSNLCQGWTPVSLNQNQVLSFYS
ncbi:MAG: DUF1861 family protein [bacterium]|nr:DUF1861 family protein [bacterium]